MRVETPADQVLDVVLPELHALFWEVPFINGKAGLDMGWACRDHAAVAGVVLAGAGHAVQVLTGRTYWIESTGDRSMGLEADPHTWLSVDGRPVDPSARLTRTPMPGRVWVGTTTSVRWLDHGAPAEYRLVHPSDDAAVDRAVRAARDGGGLTGIYQLRETLPLSRLDLADPVQSIDSPSAHRYARSWGQDVYLRVATHCHARLAGVVPSLAGLAAAKAWRKVSRTTLATATS